MPETAGPSGAALISALKKAGVYHIAALPDITTSAGLLWPVSEDPELTLIRRWCYAPKRHVMDCTEGLHSTLVKAAGCVEIKQ